MSMKNRLSNNVSRNRNYLENIFNNFFNDISDITSFDNSLFSDSLSFRVDLLENDTEYCLKAELPGMSQKDIDLKINNNTLSIEGKKTTSYDEQNSKNNYHIKEIKSGFFSRTISFPNTIDSENIKAKFQDGILTIKIPKKSESKAKKIFIEN